MLRLVLAQLTLSASNNDSWIAGPFVNVKQQQPIYLVREGTGILAWLPLNHTFCECIFQDASIKLLDLDNRSGPIKLGAGGSLFLFYVYTFVIEVAKR